MMHAQKLVGTAVIGCTIALAGLEVRAQMVISANDAKAKLIDGVNTAVPDAPPDTVTIIDLRPTPPKTIVELRIANSVVGPPQNVAVTPDGTLAFVTSSTRIDPNDSTKTVPDNLLTVIDLKPKTRDSRDRTPLLPMVLATLRAGQGASGVAVSPTGSLVLVANRGEGTISVYTIKAKNIAFIGKVNLGAPDSGPSGIAFLPNGRGALVTRNNDNKVSWLTIDGTNVQHNAQTLDVGPKPYGIDITPKGDAAVIGNTGAGATGADDMLTVIDLTTNTPRVAKQVAAGPIIEAVAISPSGRYVAASVMNNSHVSKKSPLYNDFARLRIFGLSGGSLEPLVEAPIGHWCQGVAWSGDHTVLAQCMVEQEIQTFRFDGRTLTSGAPIKVNGGPAGLKVYVP